jgi:hypothetical protein
LPSSTIDKLFQNHTLLPPPSFQTQSLSYVVLVLAFHTTSLHVLHVIASLVATAELFSANSIRVYRNHSAEHSCTCSCHSCMVPIVYWGSEHCFQ